MSVELGIREVAERAGLAAATLRVWEQRYGFPQPERTTSGYRRYRPEVVDVLRRVVELRAQGLSVPAAIERAQGGERLPTDRPSLYAALGAAPLGLPVQRLRKSTLLAMSRAIEDEALALATAPVAFAAFQQEGFYRSVEHRYRELSRGADAVAVFADFPRLREATDTLAEVPIAPDEALGNEWAVIVDAPGYAACLLAWEPPAGVERGGEEDAERRFEALWTVDPQTTRQAAGLAARLVARAAPGLGERLQALLADRPLATERPAPRLTALTNRMVGYLDGDGA